MLNNLVKLFNRRKQEYINNWLFDSGYEQQYSTEYSQYEDEYDDEDKYFNNNNNNNNQFSDNYVNEEHLYEPYCQRR